MASYPCGNSTGWAARLISTHSSGIWQRPVHTTQEFYENSMYIERPQIKALSLLCLRIGIDCEGRNTIIMPVDAFTNSTSPMYEILGRKYWTEVASTI